MEGQACYICTLLKLLEELQTKLNIPIYEVYCMFIYEWLLTQTLMTWNHRPPPFFQLSVYIIIVNKIYLLVLLFSLYLTRLSPYNLMVISACVCRPPIFLLLT